MVSLNPALEALNPANLNKHKPPAAIANPNSYSTTPQYSVPSWYGKSSSVANIPVSGQPQGDPLAELMASIMGQSAPDFNAEASSQLSGVYAPQYAALDKAKGSAQGTKKSNEAQLNAMYNALGKDITSQQGQIAGTFNNAKSATGQAYAEGQSGIRNAYNSAAANNAALLKSLGIEAAASDPRLNQQQQQQSAFLQSLLSANNQGSQNALTQEQKAAQDFNTAQRGVINAQHGEQNYMLSRSLQDRMADLDNQGISLHSAQAQAIAQMANQLSGQYADQQSNLMKQMMDAQQDKQQQSNLDRNYNLDLQKFQASQQGDLADRSAKLDQQDYQRMGPADKSYYEASRLFGQDTGKANQAVNLIMNVGAKNSYRDAFQFAQAVSENARQNHMLANLPEDQLRSLAVYMFAQMDPQTTPSYLGMMQQ
jgi:hypothetical protein